MLARPAFVFEMPAMSRRLAHGSILASLPRLLRLRPLSLQVSYQICRKFEKMTLATCRPASSAGALSECLGRHLCIRPRMCMATFVVVITPHIPDRDQPFHTLLIFFISACYLSSPAS
jgi:hypothetical protein